MASIAGESFVSMDNGGLVADHCQVVPVEHTPSFASLSPSAAAEVWSYIACVRKMLNDGGGGSNDTVDANHCAAPRDLVVFERHLALRSKGGNHVHMNCVPVPREKANKARKIFEQAAKRLGFEWDVFDAPTSAEQLQALLQVRLAHFPNPASRTFPYSSCEGRVTTSADWGARSYVVTTYITRALFYRSR